MCLKDLLIISPSNQTSIIYCQSNKVGHLSHALTVQAAMIHREMVNTSSTVPGQIVMRVFITKRVLKFILFRAPILRDDASVKSLLCSSMTRAMRYRRRKHGNGQDDIHVSVPSWTVRRKKASRAVHEWRCSCPGWGVWRTTKNSKQMKKMRS